MTIITCKQARNIAKSLGIKAAAKWLRKHNVPVQVAAYWLTGSTRPCN